MENKEPRVSQDGLSRDEKIKRIYEVVWTAKNQWNELAVHAAMKLGMNVAWPVMQSICSKFQELCWPKVMIWDVLDWLYENYWWKDVLLLFPRIAIEWLEMRRPLEKQSDECIDYVYSLIK